MDAGLLLAGTGCSLRIDRVPSLVRCGCAAVLHVLELLQHFFTCFKVHMKYTVYTCAYVYSFTCISIDFFLQL